MRAAPFLIATLALAGCQKVPDLGKLGDLVQAALPRVSFDKVELDRIDFTSVDANLLIKVDNPHDFELPLGALRYDIDLEGQRLVSGKTDGAFTLAPSASTVLSLPVHVVYTDVTEVMARTKGQDKLAVRVSGGMDFDSPVGKVEVPVDVSGELPALRTPKIALDKVRVTELAVLQNKASLAVDLSVTNEHASALSLKDVKYGFSLRSTELATGTVASLGSADAGTSTVSLPIDLSLTGVASTLIDLLTNKGDAKAGLAASLTVVTPFGDVPLSIDETGQIKIQ